MKTNPTLEYSAAVGALLAYHNIADDVKDKKGIKKQISRFLLNSAKRMKKKAALPDLDEFIKNKLDELDALEKSDEVTLDSAAQIFGELLAEIFAYGLEKEKKIIASEIGLHIGRWIYIADAADDFEKDKKRGEFNPLTEFSPERIKISLTLELEGVSRAVELITPYDDGIMNVVKNIIYLGLPSRADKIVKEEKQ